jgi:hypothetical protein
LVSPEYFGHGVIWYIPPDQKLDTNITSIASFRRNAIEHDFTTALIYRLQKKKRFESGKQSNVDNTFTEDTSAIFHLVIIWKADNSYNQYINTMLIRHNSIITWNEDKLSKLYTMHRNIYRYNQILEDTWQLDDETALMTTSKWGRMNHEIEITISEGIRRYNPMRPLQIPPSIWCDW